MRRSEVDVARFDRQCRLLRASFNVLPLSEAIQRLRENRLPSRAVCITFDDGFEDNYSNALPILVRHGLPATFFVTTGYLDGSCMWNDALIEALSGTDKTSLDSGIESLSVFDLSTSENRAQSAQKIIGSIKYLDQSQREGMVRKICSRLDMPVHYSLMMNPDQVRALAEAGMEIGGHTRTHPILARCGDSQAQEEISDCRAELEKITARKIGSFAYPNGYPGKDFSDAHADMVREAGYQCAVTTAWGGADTNTNPFLLPRFTPWDRDSLRFGVRLAGNYRNLWSR